MILGMFDWFWEFLYSLTKLILSIIDMVSQAINKISGVDSVLVGGEETDFITYMLKNDKIWFAFCIAALIGIILIFIFTIIGIIRCITSDKNEETPIQIVKKGFKNFLLLLLVPTFMFMFIIITNAIVAAMYQATQGGETSLPQFMFNIFCADAGGPNGAVWSDSASSMWSHFDLSDFSFFYSYLMGGIVLYLLLSTALMLVERAISIAMLFIISPFVVSSAVVDDGARFKQWRDLVLVKFLTGHGAVLAINVYLLFVGVIISDEVVFFSNGVLNSFVKLLFVCGGACSIKSVQAIIGNLISAGAGDKAIAENDRASHSLGGALKSVAASPFKAIRGTYNLARDSANYGFGKSVASRLGLKTSLDYKRDRALTGPGSGGGSGNRNENSPKTSGESMVDNALSGKSNDSVQNMNDQNNNNNQGGNQNNQAPQKTQGQNAVGNAVTNALNDGGKK